ncbi:MAG: hypothetical protein KDD60_07255, partial [Bdellovibrionales bacterium]|nr:hypothetical protein [Bdellovibrionales bacterium]
MKITSQPLEKAHGIICIAHPSNSKQVKIKSSSGELSLLTKMLGWNLQAEISKASPAKKNDSPRLLPVHGHKSIRGILLCPAPSSQDSTHYPNDSFRLVGSELASALKQTDSYAVSIFPSALGAKEPEKVASAILEGVKLSQYAYDRYQSSRSKKARPELSVSFLGSSGFSLSKLKDISAVFSGVDLTRNLVNTPPSDCTPKTLIAAAKELSKKPRISSKIFNYSQLKAKKMNGIIAVGKASTIDPAFITLQYNPGTRSQKKIPTVGIVGKGVTFDSGGLSIKTGSGMETMKCDMAGAAVVLGVFKALTALKLPIRVKGYIPTVENMIDG